MKKKSLRFDDEIVEKAIVLLDVLVRPGTRCILEYLNQHREATYIDLIVYAGQENLEPEIEDMLCAGILQQRKVYYNTLYRLNSKKLFRIRKAALTMTLSAEEPADLLKPFILKANS